MSMISSSSVAVIPVHNEAATIRDIVVAARQYVSVIIVDDASDDGSGRLAAASGATVLTLPSRQGKGAALRRGFAEAIRLDVDTVVTLDGDAQHDPHDIPRLLAASQQCPDCIVIGGRLRDPSGIPWHRFYAIRIASAWLNWLGDCNVRDTQSGYRVYPVALLRTVLLRHGGFLLESEILLKARLMGFGIHELPIQAVYRSGQKSQYRPLRDGALAAAYLCYRSLFFWPLRLRRHLNGWRGAHGLAWQQRTSPPELSHSQKGVV
jgi:glycosyltransferase involved in cell wall biosynthesis